MAAHASRVTVSVALIALALGACDDATAPDAEARVRSFDQITAGSRHTCGLDAASGQIYCWGRFGQFGDGAASSRTTPVALDQTLFGGISLDQVDAGGGETCGLDTSTGQAYCWGRIQFGDVDQSVLGGITFDRISAGGSHTCGLDATRGQAYCWGSNFLGQLGDGTTTTGLLPVAVDQSVLGGISFDQIAAADWRTCGLDTSTGQAYCWGNNHGGRLGDGTSTSQSTPVAVDQSVLGGITFGQIAVGIGNICGLDITTGQAYCWGSIPVAVDQSVLGGISFDQIAPGGHHTCGLDTSIGQAYCWGNNAVGQLGDGTTTSRATPVAVDQSVLGGITFDQIAAGDLHTCALHATTGEAYCWGVNREGQVGDGTTTSPRTTPTPVAGPGND